MDGGRPLTVSVNAARRRRFRAVFDHSPLHQAGCGSTEHSFASTRCNWSRAQPIDRLRRLSTRIDSRH